MEDQTVEKTRWECQDYINALEEERRKIEVFHRELPLTMQIVTQGWMENRHQGGPEEGFNAIENCRQQMAAASFFPSRSDLEGTSTNRPVLEEFIPVRPSSSLEEEKSKEMTEEATKNPDWLRSVQLWNQDASPPSEEDTQVKTPPTVGKMNSGAFHPFHKEGSSTLVATADSTVEMVGSKGDEKTEPSHRKPRRCWSSDLHRLFLSALQQLGGSHVATPKQIRELMNVDGLTNDEVKSHLQKYRLHSRRPALSFQNSSSSPQFVVVGGIWVPPPEYAAAAAAAAMTTGSKETNEAPTNKIYAPIATLPKGAHSQHQQHKHDQQSPTGPLHSEGWASPEHDHANPNSPTTSSS